MSESPTTKIISDLTKKIHTSSPMKDSVYEEASNYFSQVSTVEEQRETYKNQLLTAEKNLAKNTNKDQEKTLKKKQKDCLVNIKKFESELENQRLERVQKLNNICVEILSLCTGVNSNDTNKKFAKLLGTLSLRMPESNNVSLQYNKQCKHLYQAVLSLKLLDQLIADKLMSNKYIMEKHLQSDKEKDASFKNEVQIPLLCTVLMQNVGLLHPHAQQILKGESGEKDEFRVLDKEERLALLKYNYQQSSHYIKEALGLDKYSGNSKEERDTFNKKEKEKISFILTLLKTALKPKQSIGNLLKVPEIYTSIVMPTKRDYDYAAIPRVFQMMDNAVERGVLSKAVVNSLLKITGVFPQGYGITYIPKSDDGYDLDTYEYAIVNSLYPKKPQNPTCRIATKNLIFNASGMDFCIEPDNNLYFAHARKKLWKVNPERLKEILSKLWSNYEVRQEQFELIPRCWFPHEFFSLEKQQNIWNKTMPNHEEKK